MIEDSTESTETKFEDHMLIVLMRENGFFLYYVILLYLFGRLFLGFDFLAR